MKKQSVLILFFLLMGWGIQNGNSQGLHGRLCGTWNVTKYQSKAKIQSHAGTLIFLPDGTFLSEGIHFGIKNGLFTTDEERSVVIIEINEEKTAWEASEKNGVLRLRSVPVDKQPRVFLTLLRIK